MAEFNQYHEPVSELSQEIRTFARVIASLTEEAEAINWYEQRMSVEKNDEARKIMGVAQKEEFKHFAMDLEFLSRQTPAWRAALETVLFKSGEITKLAEKVESAEDAAAR